MVALAFSCALILLGSWFTLTSPRALIPPVGAPTADEVGAGRAAYRQLVEAKGDKAGVQIEVGRKELSSLAALASHALRPDRLRAATFGSTLRIEGSHPLIMGRWLNVTLDAEGRSAGFPPVRLTVGVVRLPPAPSRAALETARWLYLHLRHAEIPPISQIASDFAVERNGVTALLSFGHKSGVIDEMAGIVARPIDRDAVVRIYCALADQQRHHPSLELVEQVHRAFSLDANYSPPADFNRAAFLALGMLLVDDRVAGFARLRDADFHHCAIAPVPVAIYGRLDWPKHWALSAAMSVGAGTQLSEAAGEWKELADSLSPQSRFAIGDPSGFSVADLVADRAGFELANAAAQPGGAARIARKLAGADPQQLLPHSLIEQEDGLSNAEFVRRYGGIDDPRFQARIRQIDLGLDRWGLR